jgi:RNA polymerase sigma-70 factor (ECF subfamily)
VTPLKPCKTLKTLANRCGVPFANKGRMSIERHTDTLPDMRLEEMAEADLVAAAKSGCEAAFSELMLRTRGMCLRLAASLLRDDDEAADEVQNAFWKAYVNLATFEGQSALSTWLVRIVINCCMTRLRSDRIKAFSFDATLEDGHTASFAVPHTVPRDCPEGLLASEEVRALVRDELEKLPIILREPLEYRYMHDLALDEIASRLGISLPAAKSRLSRGHQYLKDRMIRHCGCRGPATLLDAAA